jgi:hypothetical protein
LSQAPSLPPKLEGALLQVPDQAFAGRLRSIFRAAALTLHRLSDVDLVRYEAPESETSWDLALWEELAPVIAETVTGINTLVQTVRTELEPKGQGTDLASLLDQTVDEVSVDTDGERTAEVQRTLRRESDELAALVAQLGERVRSPSVVSDRWNLLAEVQSFRSRFRSEVGNLVFDIASRYSDLPREALVPGHAEDLQAALAVRSALANLRRSIEARCQAIRGANSEDVQWHATGHGARLLRGQRRLPLAARPGQALPGGGARSPARDEDGCPRCRGLGPRLRRRIRHLAAGALGGEPQGDAHRA